MNINAIMAELAQYIRMQEEAAAMVESLKDQLKAQMQAAGVDTLAGDEHKATYKAVTSSRVDTSALKRDLPEIAAQYTKTTTARRFTFAEIRAAAVHGVRVFLDVGRRWPRVPCRVAANVRGWVTAVSDNGGIYQAWAGEFYGEEVGA